MAAPTLTSATPDSDHLDWKFVQSFGDDNSSDGQTSEAAMRCAAQQQRMAALNAAKLPADTLQRVEGVELLEGDNN